MPVGSCRHAIKSMYEPLERQHGNQYMCECVLGSESVVLVQTVLHPITYCFVGTK